MLINVIIEIIIKIFWWLNWPCIVNKYWIVITIDTLIKGIEAAVFGLNMNEGNSAIPGARYIKNIKLNTTIRYEEVIAMRLL